VSEWQATYHVSPRSQRSFHESPTIMKLGRSFDTLVMRAIHKAVVLVDAVRGFYERRRVEANLLISERMRANGRYRELGPR